MKYTFKFFKQAKSAEGLARTSFVALGLAAGSLFIQLVILGVALVFGLAVGALVGIFAGANTGASAGTGVGMAVLGYIEAVRPVDLSQPTLLLPWIANFVTIFAAAAGFVIAIAKYGSTAEGSPERKNLRYALIIAPIALVLIAVVVTVSQQFVIGAPAWN
jgi:hypothetical protein